MKICDMTRESIHLFIYAVVLSYIPESDGKHFERTDCAVHCYNDR